MSVLSTLEPTAKTPSGHDEDNVVALSRVLRRPLPPEPVEAAAPEPLSARSSRPDGDDPSFSEGADSPTVLPGRMSLLAALEEIAADWFGRERTLTDADSAAQALAPEALAATAVEMGLDLVMVQKPLSGLKRADCPCLIVDHEGHCRLVVKRINKWAFLCRTPEGDAPIDRGALKASHSGVVFLVHPHKDFAEFRIDEMAEEEHAKAAHGSVGSVMGLLISTMLRRKGMSLLQVTVASGISNVLLIIVPLFSMAVYDRVLPHMAFETLWALSIGMTIALLADLGLRHVKLKLIDSIAADIGHVVQVRFFKRLVQGRMAGLPRTGGALAQTIRDLESFCQLVPAAFLSLSVDIPFVIVTSIVLATIAGTVALVPLGGALLIALIYAAAHAVGRSRLAPYLSLLRLQSNTVIETIEGMETVKTTSAETMLLNRWERLADATAFGSHLSRIANGFAAQCSMTVSQAMTVAALILGVYEISQNSMTVGALSASTMLIGRLISPITQLIGQFQRILQAKKTLEPIRVVLNAPLERAGDREAHPNRAMIGRLDLRHVGYTYPGAQAPSLTDVTLTIRPGERIGIIGRVGSGKSTLLRLIVRLHEPDEGTIRLDGHDIRQTSPRLIRKRFAYMKQDTTLFDDTLRANLFFGLECPEPTLVEEAAAISGVASFAARNPEGYGMRVGPRGERLSGGERQAVGLARALIGDPSMLLLDEPTASMDNTTERQIIDGLARWLGNRTLVVATHRAALLDLVDRIILMNEGRIVADGPKEEILRKLSSNAG